MLFRSATFAGRGIAVVNVGDVIHFLGEGNSKCIRSGNLPGLPEGLELGESDLDGGEADEVACIR